MHTVERGSVFSSFSKIFTPSKFKHHLHQSSKDQSSFVWFFKVFKKMCRIQAQSVFNDVHTSGITSCTRVNILHYLSSYSPWIYYSSFLPLFSHNVDKKFENKKSNQIVPGPLNVQYTE
ncbi:hypothetical protein QL285_046204 [Trifolium repens]|nr:hypothetical protein QL285_046204 [Trifolium repens]